MKMPEFGTKNALFGYFWVRMLENCGHICSQHPRICLIAKFWEKARIPKLGAKNVFFGYF